MFTTADCFRDKMLAMADRYEFSEWLNTELERRGWSQADLARAAGITRSAVNGVITGSRGAGNEFCIAVSNALNLPPEEVFRHAGLLPPQPDIDPKLAEINYLLATLPPDLQEEALSYLRYLIEKEDNKKARGNNLDFKKTLGTSNAN